jgi:hypothetical protein
MQRLEVSSAVQPIEGSLGVKGLNTVYIKFHQHQFVQNVLWGKENDLA